MSVTELQKAVCARFNSPVVEARADLKCGVALKTIGAMPIYGLREAQEGGTNGWYFWCGEQSQADDFFDPLCTAHLADYLPEVLAYLSLAPGYGFVIDDRGYEDVWFRPDFDEAS